MGVGKFNPSYVGGRPDIEALVPKGATAVLDVGCSNGSLGIAIKKKTGAEVTGIEISADMSIEAAARLDVVHVGDAAKVILNGTLGERRFDVIVFADILEHLVDPWTVLNAATGYLTREGIVIASIPNIRHIDSIYNLVIKGRWPYRDRGIHDRTHLRFFTRTNILELFEGANLNVQSVNVNYRFFERPHNLNRFARFVAIPGLRGFLAFQYLVLASVRKAR